MPIWIPLAVGAVALAAFVVRQLRLGATDRVLLNLAVFRHSTFTVAVVLVVVAMTTLFGVLILLPLYLQNVLGLGTLPTGLMLLPGGLLMGLMAPLVGTLFDRFGARPPRAAGCRRGGRGPVGLRDPLGVDAHRFRDRRALRAEPRAGVHVHPAHDLGARLAAARALPARIRHRVDGPAARGAAGTALFVTLMTVGAASAASEGSGIVEATASGIHTAFFVAACLSLAVIVLAAFVRTPKRVEGGEGAPAH